MKIRATLRQILERLPEIRLAKGASPEFSQNVLIDGIERMPVEW